MGRSGLQEPISSRRFLAPVLAALLTTMSGCGTLIPSIGLNPERPTAAPILEPPDAGSEASESPQSSRAPSIASQIGQSCSKAGATAASPQLGNPVTVGDDVEVLPIDLPTALRLVNASNPTVALAQARVTEAFARLQQAEWYWLPDLRSGPTYLRQDGRNQGSHGEIFDISKSNLFEGAGLVMSFRLSDALFGPLVARRLVEAQSAQAAAVSQTIQLETALAYQDLLAVYGRLAINRDTMARAEDLVQYTERAARQELVSKPADVNRARAELEERKRQRIDVEADLGTASARLAQLLLLRPSVDLQPTEPAAVPIALVPTVCPLDELVATGLMNRPELAESRALVEAAVTRWRQARVSPLLPRFDVAYAGGTFGGGINDVVGNFGARGDALAQATWEFHNLLAGDIARANERRSQYEQANLHVTEVQARIAAEIVAAAKNVRARERSLASAQEGVIQSLEAWRRLRIGAYGMSNPRTRLLDTLEPLIALRTLADARERYLQEVIEFNKAQFRLYAAMGNPPMDALATATPVPVQIAPSPPPPNLAQP